MGRPGRPKIFETYNLLRFCVSEEVRAMWAALTEDVEGAPADDYPSDIEIDSTDAEELAKKRDWHVECQWPQAVTAYYSTSQQDSVYGAIRQHVVWDRSRDKPTRNTIAEWALSFARPEKAVAPEAWSAADPKALFAACARVLPGAIRTLLQQNKPEKSDLRNHQAIVQPRLYDCLMVTQITLNTEPHGFDPCQRRSYEKADMGYPGLIRSPWPGVVGAGLLLS